MSHKLSWVGTACAVACSLMLVLRMGASADADVIVGAPGNAGNLFPFVSYNGGMTSEYQQAYAAADFSGPITITGLSFFGKLPQAALLLSRALILSVWRTARTPLAHFRRRSPTTLELISLPS